MSARACRLSDLRGTDGGWVLRLIDSQLAAAGQRECGQQTTALVLDRTGRRARGRKLVDDRPDIVTHQVDLMPAVLLGWMYSDFRGRKCKDQPAATGIHVGETQHVAQEGAIRIGVLAVDDGMRATDHRPYLHGPRQ